MRVIKVLLGREEVTHDKPDNGGRTPLSYAADRGFEEAVEMLLGREEVNPNKPDNRGRTPLMLAASGADEGVQTLLQSRKVVSPLPKRNSTRKKRRLCTDTLPYSKSLKRKIP